MCPILYSEPLGWPNRRCPALILPWVHLRLHHSKWQRHYWTEWRYRDYTWHRSYSAILGIHEVARENSQTICLEISFKIDAFLRCMKSMTTSGLNGFSFSVYRMYFLTTSSMSNPGRAPSVHRHGGEGRLHHRLRLYWCKLALYSWSFLFVSCSTLTWSLRHFVSSFAFLIQEQTLPPFHPQDTLGCPFSQLPPSVECLVDKHNAMIYVSVHW